MICLYALPHLTSSFSQQKHTDVGNVCSALNFCAIHFFFSEPHTTAQGYLFPVFSFLAACLRISVSQKKESVKKERQDTKKHCVPLEHINNHASTRADKTVIRLFV